MKEKWTEKLLKNILLSWLYLVIKIHAILCAINNIEIASEVNHLKMEVEALTTACKEKDQQLQEVQQSLSKFKRVSTVT